MLGALNGPGLSTAAHHAVKHQVTQAHALQAGPPMYLHVAAAEHHVRPLCRQGPAQRPPYGRGGTCATDKGQGVGP